MKNTEHLKSSDGSPFAACDDGRHGADCEKAPHSSNGGYLHAAEDDSPYNVDGLTYCGRCHRPFPLLQGAGVRDVSFLNPQSSNCDHAPSSFDFATVGEATTCAAQPCSALRQEFRKMPATDHFPFSLPMPAPAAARISAG